MVSHDDLVSETGHWYSAIWQPLWFINTLIGAVLLIWWTLTFLGNDIVSEWYTYCNLLLGRDVGLYLTTFLFLMYSMFLMAFKRNIVLAVGTVWLELFLVLLWEALNQAAYLFFFDDASHYTAWWVASAGHYLTYGRQFRSKIPN